MKLILTILFLISWLLVLAPAASAAVSCTASVSPTSVYTDSSSTYTFSLTNSSSDTIRWIRITIPSPVYWSLDTFTNPSGWTGTNTNDEYVTFTGGALSGSGSLSISLVAGTNSFTAASTAWTVQVSDDAGGSSPVNCTGSLGTSIISLSTAPAISNVSISDVTDSEAKFTWTTNVAANSVVNYGATSSYGSTKSSSPLTTSHSVTLIGLSANTTYHYQIQSTATGSSTGQTSDSTFTTSKQQSTTVTITTSDTTAPVISLTFDTSTPFATPPKVSGTATDNIGVTIVEYSLTGGNIYTKATLAKSGAQSTAFDFTLPKLADGTYTLKIRTRDAAANTGTFKDIKFTLDTAGPAVTITTDLTKPFAASPTITATATDPAGVSSVEYSLDKGISWTAINQLTFTPPPLPDGNYPISIRSTDSIGNSSLDASLYTLIIDRLPPIIGPYDLSAGILPLSPDQTGMVTTLAGVPLRFTIQIIGGPTSATLSLSNEDFPLTPVPNSDFWTTQITPQSGTHSISLYAIDGAANTGQRTLGQITSLPPGQIKSSASSGQITLRVFTKNQESQGFTSWDSAGFPFANPQSLPSGNTYSLLLPPGTYYLQASAKNHAPFTSDFFTLSRPTPITLPITLTPYPSLSFGPLTLYLPFTKSASASFNYQSPLTINDQRSTNFPEFNLFVSPTSTLTHLDLRGQPTLVTLLAPWSPAAAAQMQILESLAKVHSQLKIVVLLPQTTAISAAVYKARGGYTLPIIADPDGTLITPLNFSYSPTHFILNNSGLIQKVLIGLQGEEDLKLAFDLN